MRYLLACDIANPRRLRRVARRMERWAVRCQKSVFLFNGDERDLLALLDLVNPLLDASADVLQAWRLSPGQPTYGLVRGTATPIVPLSVVLYDRLRLFVTGRSDVARTDHSPDFNIPSDQSESSQS